MLILVVIFLFTLVVAIKTVSYAIYEWKNKNKFGSVFLIALSIVAVIFPTVMCYIKL